MNRTLYRSPLYWPDLDAVVGVGRRYVDVIRRPAYIVNPVTVIAKGENEISCAGIPDLGSTIGAG